MPRCDFCGKNVSLPFHCQYCGKNFCDEHRLPPNHDCAGLAVWKKTPAPGVGIRYGAGGTSAYGGGYAAKPADKKPGRVPFWKHPYFRIAVVLAVIVLLIIVFVLMGGCLQQAGENVTLSSTPSPALPAATTTLALTTITPNTTPLVTVVSTSAATPTLSPAPAIPSETIATATATPPFPLVTARVSDDPNPVQGSSLASRIHDLINEQRAQNGLAALSYDPALAALALNHSTDMATNNYFSHIDPAGEDPTARGNASGIYCVKNYGSYYTYGIAENIFQNNLYTSVTDTNGVYSYAWSTPEEIAQSTVTGWMNSPGHRKNILTATYDSEGLGVAVSADDKVYITEDFC
jgi:uncharacterized protein YkwD